MNQEFLINLVGWILDTVVIGCWILSVHEKSYKMWTQTMDHQLLELKPGGLRNRGLNVRLRHQVSKIFGSISGG